MNKEHHIPLVLRIKATPTIRLDQQRTIETQHCPQPQTPTQVPNCLYFRGAQTHQHKKGENVFK